MGGLDIIKANGLPPKFSDVWKYYGSNKALHKEIYLNTRDMI
jgi:hypothetical protein